MTCRGILRGTNTVDSNRYLAVVVQDRAAPRILALALPNVVTEGGRRPACDYNQLLVLTKYLANDSYIYTLNSSHLYYQFLF
jgi:hypothetical protein